MKVAIYARVSTDDKNQNPETQLFALRKFCVNAGWEIYCEYVDRARAKDYKARMAWGRLLSDARMYRFNVVMVWKLDRAFRSVRECVNILADWQERNIKFKAITQEAIDTTTSMGKFVLQIMAATAELESSLIGDRVKSGIERRRAEGKAWGRKRKPFDKDRAHALLDSGLNISQVALALNCSRRKVYRELCENIGQNTENKKAGETGCA